MEILLGAFAITLLVVFAYLLADYKLDSSFATAFGGLVTGAGVIVGVITLRKIQQANDFSLITAVHARLNEEKSYQARRYLFSDFGQHLAEAAKVICGHECVMNDHVVVEKVLLHVKEDREKETAFNNVLSKRQNVVAGMSPLDAVERVILDFELIALPYSKNNASALVAAEAWEPVLRRTSEQILPFLAIKRRLRGEGDRSYKYHYLNLLANFDIDLMGLTVPPIPGRD
jgi:hypothetical protein